MKLNLLPATVSRGRQAKTAWVASIVIIFVGIGISLALTLSSAENLKKAKEDYQASKPAAEEAARTAAIADSLMAKPELAALTRNVSLAQAMISHNDKYPNLYNSLRQWIPPFFRLTSLAASPVSEGQAAVTMVGTLGTYQQYADLMLALMRNPAAVSVARSGYQSDEQYVPQLTDVDQQGRPRVPGEAPIPDDPLERLAFFQAQGAGDPGAFVGAGNFGSGTPNTRLNMPDQSLVTVQLIVNYPIQVPNPRVTLASGGGAPAGGGGIPGPGGMPGPGGPPVPGSSGGRDVAR